MNKEFEKIIEKLEEYKYENLVEHDYEQSQHCKDIGDCGMRDCVLCVLDKAIEIVKQEAEQYNNGWIPCSEQLPELETEVLIYTEQGGMTIASLTKPDIFWEDEEGNILIGVIAWHPLPEPYQPKGE